MGTYNQYSSREKKEVTKAPFLNKFKISTQKPESFSFFFTLEGKTLWWEPTGIGLRTHTA